MPKPRNQKRDAKIIDMHHRGQRSTDIAKALKVTKYVVAGVLDRAQVYRAQTNVPQDQVEQIVALREGGDTWEYIAHASGWSVSTCRRLYRLYRKDPRTGRPFGDHGTAQQAITYALEHTGFLADEFLRAWRRGDLKDWPKFYRWLDTCS